MRLLLLTLAIFGFQSQTLAQDSELRRVWEHESSDVPVDFRIHFGHFANGIRYAWVDNSEPKDRCYVRLHVNVGSLTENSSEAFYKNLSRQEISKLAKEFMNPEFGSVLVVSPKLPTPVGDSAEAPPE